MEWISELVRSSFWPAVVIVVFFMLRREFRGLMGRLARISHGGTLLEFSDTSPAARDAERNDFLGKWVAYWDMGDGKTCQETI
ncbi:MAG: hypothetical protein ACYSWO_28780, partial [Planctomycetota bacterium]